MRKVWRCFHCDLVFRSVKAATEHFGASLMSMAACQIKGHEHNLIRLIRDQEAQLATYRNEDGQILRAMESLKSEHEYALRRMEEVGYARGLRDAKDFPLELAPIREGQWVGVSS